MNATRTAPPTPATVRHVLLAAASALALAGCPRQATFRVTHPALINATQVGNTYSLGPTALDPTHVTFPESADELRADLAQRITNSLNPSVRFLPLGGGLTVLTNLIQLEYRENISENAHTCSRQVAAGRDAAGNTIYRTNQYPCVDRTRGGECAVRVGFRVVVSQSGQPVYDHEYSNIVRRDTSVRDTTSAVAPPPIDGRAVCAQARAWATDRFARVIVPWQEDVRVRYEDCGGEPLCKSGFDAVRAGDLGAAERMFLQVLGPYADPSAPAVPPEQTERVGEALYNLGVTRGYMGRYVESVRDLERAIAIMPDNARRWAERAEEVRSLARDQQELLNQGAFGAPAGP